MVFQLLSSLCWLLWAPTLMWPARHVPFQCSLETLKLCLMVALDCWALWYLPDFAPTTAGTMEQSSEMSDLRVSPPWLICPSLLPQLCVILSPSQAQVQPLFLVSYACQWLSDLMLLVCGRYSMAPEDGWWSSPACMPVLTMAWTSLTALVSCRNTLRIAQV